MAATLPVTKLAGLFVKTLAKPLSKRIKHDFARYDATKRMLISIGQTNHTVTSYMTIWATGYRVRSIKPIEAEKALKDGAEFIGEGFVLMVTATTVIFEYNRSAKNAELKNEKKRERIKADQQKLQAKLNTLDIRLKAVEDLIKQQQELEDKQNLLTRVVPVGGTGKPKYVEPPKENLVPIEDDAEEDQPVTTQHREAVKDDEVTISEIQKTEQGMSALKSKKSEVHETSAPWWKLW